MPRLVVTVSCWGGSPFHRSGRAGSMEVDQDKSEGLDPTDQTVERSRVGKISPELGPAVGDPKLDIGELGLDHLAHLTVDGQLVDLPVADRLTHRLTMPVPMPFDITSVG